MSNHREELNIKVVLDTQDAEAKVAELEARINALAAKLSGGSGSGMASGAGFSGSGMGFSGAGMGYGPMGIPAGALPANGGGAGLPFFGMALTAGLGAAAGNQLAANMARGAAALGAASPASTLPPMPGTRPSIPGGTPDDGGVADLADLAMRQAGIDPSIRDARGRTAWQHALQAASDALDPLVDVDDDGNVFNAGPNPASGTFQQAAPGAAGAGAGAGGAGTIPPAVPPGTGSGPEGRPPFRQRARDWFRDPANRRAMGYAGAGAAATAYVDDSIDAYLTSYRTETSTQVRQIATGRSPKPWDDAVARRQRETMWLDTAATGLAAAAGFVIGEVAVPGVGGFFSGPAFGAAVHGWINNITNAQGEREQQIGEARYQRDMAWAGYQRLTGNNRGPGNASTDTILGMTAFTAALAPGLGAGASNFAASVYGDLGGVTSDEATKQQYLKRMAAGITPETARLMQGGFSREALRAVMQVNMDAGLAWAKTQGLGPLGMQQASVVANAQTMATRAERFGVATGQYADAARSTAARGGDANQIGSALTGEAHAYERAAGATRDYIKSLEAVGNLTEDQKLKLDQAKTALASYNAQVDEIRYTVTRLKSDEALDIAGTRSEVSGARLPERLAGARRGDTTLYDSALLDLAGEADTIAAELRRPGLKPEDRRRLKRQQAQTQAALFGLEREAADYLGSEPSRFADMTAQGASLWGRLTALNNGSPEQVAQTNRNVSWRQGEATYASSGYLAFMRQNPRFYSDEQIKTQENVVLANKVAYAESAVTAGAAPFTAGMANTLEGLDLETRRAMRDGGSLSALGVAGRQRGFWQGRIHSINATADQQIRITPQFRQAINDRRHRDLLGASNALFALDDLEGVYSPDPELSMRYENSQADYRILMNDPFRPGSRRDASMARMAPVQTMIAEVRRQMETASPANRARLTRTLNALRVEESEISRDETEGWLGRVLDYESGRPGHASMFLPTNKDVLRFNPNAGRFFGAGDRESAERMRDRRVYGQSDATNRPGDTGAQTLKLIAEPVKVQFDMRMPDGTIQRQTADVRFQVQSDPRQRAMAERAR